MDLKIAADENAVTQPKFELGIFGIIQNVFNGDKTKKQKLKKLLENINYFLREGGGGGGTPPWKIP